MGIDVVSQRLLGSQHFFTNGTAKHGVVLVVFAHVSLQICHFLSWIFAVFAFEQRKVLIWLLVYICSICNFHLGQSWPFKQGHLAPLAFFLKKFITFCLNLYFRFQFGFQKIFFEFLSNGKFSKEKPDKIHLKSLQKKSIFIIHVRNMVICGKLRNCGD